MGAPDLLKALLTAPGPSGHEEEPARIWREAALAFADVTSDTLGTSFARVRAAGGDGNDGGGKRVPTLALVGHIDEVGIAITHIEENGLLAFATIGGISAEMLMGQRFEFLTKAGPVAGVVSRRRISPEQLRDRPRPELTDLHVDIGACSGEDAESMIRVGDAGVWNGAPVELPNGRLLSRALDNRLGAYVALEAARRIAESRRAQVDVVAVAAAQEEVGLYGARVAAYSLDPQVAIAIDVTPATDYPGGDVRRLGKVELGIGAMIARGPTLNKQVVELLATAAEEEQIPHAFEIYSRTTSTDADEIHLTRAGIPTALLSIPTRYLHSPNEICDLADVEAIVSLIVAFAERLGADESYVR
ncbi:MAG: M20/M25/M40 family metallo-hydrolase [Actinobacteria bacterium]|nr:M20/M25/M40 family metallo-hydrolase [Actinomycetota bacterium]